jgi:hypothetical protein
MVGKVRGGLESCSVPNIVRPVGFVRRLLNAVQRVRDPTAPREAGQHLESSDEKLTDEMERRIMEELMRNRSFRL